MHHAFLYLSFPSWHDYNANLPNFTFCGGRDNKTTASFFFSYLRYSFLDFYSKTICQHLTNLTSWNERDKVWDRANSLFKWRFCCLRLRCCLSSLLLIGARLKVGLICFFFLVIFRSIKFGNNSSSQYLISITNQYLTVWNLLSCSGNL